MKRKSIMFYTYSAIFLIIAAFFLPQLLFIRVLAKEEYKPKTYKYYTSIEIQEGDTLWSIACQYADELFHFFFHSFPVWKTKSFFLSLS